MSKKYFSIRDDEEQFINDLDELVRSNVEELLKITLQRVDKPADRELEQLQHLYMGSFHALAFIYRCLIKRESLLDEDQ